MASCCSLPVASLGASVFSVSGLPGEDARGVGLYRGKMCRGVVEHARIVPDAILDLRRPLRGGIFFSSSVVPTKQEEGSRNGRELRRTGAYAKAEEVRDRSPRKGGAGKQVANPWSEESRTVVDRSSSKARGRGTNVGSSSKSKKSPGNSRPAKSSAKSSAKVHVEDELAFLRHLSPPPEIENEKEIYPEESFPGPLWSTFCSSVSGVWRGVGAAFSPITAEFEPLSVDRDQEYLFDARVLNFVEVVRTSADGATLPPDRHYLSGRVLWSLESPLGRGADVEVSPVADEDDGILALDSELSVDDEELDYWEVEENGGEIAFNSNGEMKSLLGTEEEAGGISEEEDGNLEAMPDLTINVDSDDDNDLTSTWSSREPDSDWDVLTSSAENPSTPTGPAFSPEHSADGLGTTWADVMEEDVMEQQQGFVYFEDGSYSRGPLELLKGTSKTEREYVNAHTFKIEQCLVAGGHKRLRVVHTVQVESEGEQVEVLRLAVYEEEWMGPCSMKSISEAGGHALKPFTDRPRQTPKELVGDWKVFEKEALAFIPPENSTEKSSFSYSSREVLVTRGLPEMPEENPDYVPEENEEIDITPFSVLWLTGGVSAYVDISHLGQMTFGVGWMSSPESRLVMERTYDENGKLLNVKSKTEIEASIGVPM